MTAKVEGGYAKMPRALFMSDFWHTSSNLCRCLWIYLWAMANHRDRGKIKRGQILTTLEMLCDAMTYHVGYRQMRPKVEAVRSALRKLHEGRMIERTKTVRGTIISIVNYDRYQDASNYEGPNESPDVGRTKALTKPLTKPRSIHKKEEGKKEEEKKKPRVLWSNGDFIVPPAILTEYQGRFPSASVERISQEIADCAAYHEERGSNMASPRGRITTWLKNAFKGKGDTGEDFDGQFRSLGLCQRELTHDELIELPSYKARQAEQGAAV